MTTTAGFLLASRWHIDVVLLFATLIGTSTVIASACIINNIIDRTIDRTMDRTKKRALVTGAISVRQAVVLAVILGVGGFGLLAVFINLLTLAIGVVGYIDYIILYGFYKRSSTLGTIVGSVSGSTPIIAGYCAVTGRVDSAAIILFISMTLWQMPHFYSIAIFRARDYAAAKLPVLPVKKGFSAAKLQIVLYIIAYIIAIDALTVYGHTGHIYLLAMTLFGGNWLRVALQGFGTTDDIAWARRCFGQSLVMVLVFSMAVSVGALIP